MSKLLDKTRKAELMTKLHLSLQKHNSFQSDSNLTQSQLIRFNQSNDDLTKQLQKILQMNNKKKSQLKQKLISGPIGIDIKQQMQDLKWRMSVLRQNHRSQRTKNQYNSLIPTNKTASSWQAIENKQKLTFNQLYNIQKQKFAALRQRRKTKRLNPQYLDMIGNKQSRKQRNKQLNQQKFNQQMRLLDQAIQN